MKKCMLLLLACGLLGLGALSGCNSSPIVKTYAGEEKELEEVAVLIYDDMSPPVFTIDGECKDLKRRPDCEFRLDPGEHSVEIFTQKISANEQLHIQKKSLRQNFVAGRVYTLKKERLSEDPQDLEWNQWAGVIEDQGTMVEFATANPKYNTGNGDWKKLRKDNDLIPSFWDRFKWSKDKDEEEQVQQF